MATALIPEFDILGAQGGLSSESISHIGQAFITVRPDTYNQSLDWLIANVSRLAVSVDVSNLTSAADIRTLLDAGAARVFARLEQLQDLRPAIDDTRLVLVLDMDHSKDQIVDAIAETPLGVYAQQIKDLDFVTGWLKEYGASNRPPVYVSFGYTPNIADVQAICSLAAIPIIPAHHLTVDVKSQPDLLSVADLIVAAASTDRSDGLYTTLVVDERGIALGLVYSSAESIAESLRTGRGVYQSRKRGLWYKGATSGAIQELVKVDLDCDGDCLRYVVRQKGTGRFNSSYFKNDMLANNT